jgi:diguanylate cyclase (GGDEF)-like protein/PAS domain S-box-containing protein
MQRTLAVYRSIAEYATDSIFVTDKHARVIYQNPAAKKNFGFEDEEVSGHLLHDMIHHHDPDGKTAPLEQCHVQRAVVHGETARDFVWTVFRKDGSTFFASCTVSPVYVEGEIVGAIFFAVDITARKTAEDALLKSNEQLKLAAEAADLGVFDHDLGTDKLIWSDKIKEHFGLPPGASIPSLETAFAQIHPDDRDRVRQIVEGSSEPGSDGRYEFECRTIDRRDGRQRWIVTRGRWLFDDQGKPVRRIGTSLDVTERKLVEQRLLDASRHDALTGLPNRALLFEHCTYLIAMAERAHAGGGAVLFIDLDRFKPINDLYGHEVGDKVLQEVARRLRESTRREDMVSRLGGDEFVVVLPRVDSTYGPVTVAQHILDKVGQPIQVGELTVSVSPSIGISLFPAHSSNLETLIRCADLAMYSAKKAGKNTFRIYTPGLDEQAGAALRLEIQIKQALQSYGITLFYQPVMDINTGRLIGVEALCRLRDENGKFLSPAEFIPVAESAGLIHQLGECVVGEACRQHERWRNAGMPPFSVAINLSPIQFRQKILVDQLANAIEQTGIDPACLQVEVTESAVMADVPAAIKTLNEIKSLGIRVALDDFGTGYSSLSYLGRLPLDKLKIDQSFIHRLDSDEANRSITEAIIALGRSLKLKVVGEGIESEHVMDYLRDQGCDQAQGFLFSRPLPAPEFESWYRDQQQRYH